MNPGGLPKNSKKVDERGGMQRYMIERGDPLCSIFGKNLRRTAVTNFIVADRSFTADSDLL